MSLCFPETILDQHVVVLGKTRSGKSSALRHIAEHLLGRKKRVCIIDPKGDWWGIKSSADGRDAGFPVIAFGDFKDPKAADIPLKPEAAGQVVDLITSGYRPCVIGLRGWMPSALTKFWLSFAPALFNANLGEFYLIGDEFHNFAPKGKILDPDAGKCLHWANRLASEGLGLGLHLLIASQRPQKVHNDTLTCCETLVAMRVIHAADRDAVKSWVDGCGDGVQGKEVLQTLAQMERGEAWVWSPESSFGPKRLKFPMFSTFDSFAEPKLRPIESPSTWADVNLDAVKTKLAKVIEDSRANDPAELRRQLADERKRSAALEKSHTKSNREQSAPRVLEKRIIAPAELKRFEAVGRRIAAAADKLAADLARLSKRQDGLFSKMQLLSTRHEGSNKIGAATASSERPLSVRTAPPPRVTAPIGAASNGALANTERKLLTCLAQFQGRGRTKRQLALLTNYAAGGGGFRNLVSALRSRGFAQGDDVLTITEAGLSALGDWTPLPTGHELFLEWMRHPQLGAAEREILRVLYESPGEALTREQIAERTVSPKGTPYEADGGGFRNALGKVRTLELVEGRAEMRIAEELL